MTTAELTGEDLEDAGREAGFPRHDDRPWSDLTAEEKREALARAENGDEPDEEPDEERSVWARVVDDVENGRLSTRDALLGLLRTLDDPENPEDGFYPDEAESNG